MTALFVDGITEMHWQGKFRGPDFAPLSFLLKGVTSQRLIDSKGRNISTVVASYLTDTAIDNIAAVSRDNENRVLAAYADNPNVSLSDVARSLGWNLKSNMPDKKKVKRMIKKLRDAKLMTMERDKPALTDKGRKVAAEAKPSVAHGH